jgi:hypothetical protein
VSRVLLVPFGELLLRRGVAGGQKHLPDPFTPPRPDRPPTTTDNDTDRKGEPLPMRDLNHDFKQLGRHNRDGAFGTQATREAVLALVANQLCQATR